MVKVLSRMLMVALAVVVAANFALAQDGEGKKKGEGKGKRGPFNAEQFIKDNGGKEVDGKLVLTKDDFLAAQKAKGREGERVEAMAKWIFGEDKQVDVEGLKKKMEERRAEWQKKGGGKGGKGKKKAD